MQARSQDSVSVLSSSMSNSNVATRKRKFVQRIAVGAGMALLGLGMFLDAVLQGNMLSGSSFNLAWVLSSVCLLLALFWTAAYFRAGQK